MGSPPSTVFHAGTLKKNPGVTFATIRRSDAEEWATEAGDDVFVHRIVHKCASPASVEDVRDVAASLGLTVDDFDAVSPYGNDPDYSPFDWLYDARVRTVLERRGFDCAAGPDFMIGRDVPIVALWIPGSFKVVDNVHEIRQLVRSVLFHRACML